MKKDFELFYKKTFEFPKFIVNSKTSCYNCSNLQVFYEQQEGVFGSSFKFSAECKAHKNCIICKDLFDKIDLEKTLKNIICSDGRYELNN